VEGFIHRICLATVHVETDDDARQRRPLLTRRRKSSQNGWTDNISARSLYRYYLIELELAGVLQHPIQAGPFNSSPVRIGNAKRLGL
jgi:hypothetical protein